MNKPKIKFLSHRNADSCTLLVLDSHPLIQPARCLFTPLCRGPVKHRHCCAPHRENFPSTVITGRANQDDRFLTATIRPSQKALNAAITRNRRRRLSTLSRFVATLLIARLQKDRKSIILRLGPRTNALPRRSTSPSAVQQSRFVENTVFRHRAVFRA